MKSNRLGHSDLVVPEICLGTMTFGEQNNQNEAFEQLAYALDQNIHFWDTAEMYPVPLNQKHRGRLKASLGIGLLKTVSVTNLSLPQKLQAPNKVAVKFVMGIPSL